MTEREATMILNPKTTKLALAEIGEHTGNSEHAKRKAVDDACIIACKALEKQERLKEAIDRINQPEYRHVVWMQDEVVLLLQSFMVERS